MNGLRRFLSRIWQAITGLLQPVWRFFTRWTTTAKGTLVSFLHGVRERHQHRIDTDPSYPVALASGSTAVIGVLAASPALAAALGVLVGELVGAGERRSTPFTRPRPATSWGGRRSSWDDDGPRPWDRTDWDDE